MRASRDPRPGAPDGFVMFWPPRGWSLGPADYSNPGMATVPFCPAHALEQRLTYVMPLEEPGRVV